MDRNPAITLIGDGLSMSLSARRAWIEIAAVRVSHRRNKGRSPQGERG